MFTVGDQHPLQQGLRPILSVLIKLVFQVGDQHPLQQGLRRRVLPPRKSCSVGDQHPLQQGLRPVAVLLHEHPVYWSETNIHYNKD